VARVQEWGRGRGREESGEKESKKALLLFKKIKNHSLSKKQRHRRGHPHTLDTHTRNMAPITRARANWAVDRATGLPEVWALVAAHLGLVGAWRLMRVCRAARVGAKEFLSTLPGLVVCGGHSQGGVVRHVWMLDLATLRWEPMPGLVTARYDHACCAVRGKLVVLGGVTSAYDRTSSKEVLSSEEGAFFVDLLPLSCGAISGAAAITVEESDSAAGQVFLLGGDMQGGGGGVTVRLVDLATGVCTPGRPDMLRSRYMFEAAGLPGGDIVGAGGFDGGDSSAEVWGPPVQGALDAAWSWRHLPAMRDERRPPRRLQRLERWRWCHVLVRGVGDRRHFTPS
jgi:hypothetical protein